jgi:sterol desaturase/sphingolipid hydroxylase (fatty acid hydroxylase superfamily)
MGKAPRLKLINSIISSPINYWLAITFDVVGLCVIGRIAANAYAPYMIIVFLAGLILWSFAEYALHRWFLHGDLRFAECHTRHHWQPKEACSVPVGLIQAILGLMWMGLAWMISIGPATWLTLGLFAGYNYYALLHHAQHHLIRSDRHEIHHWDLTTNFGVTTSIWDRIFRTKNGDTVVVWLPRKSVFRSRVRS